MDTPHEKLYTVHDLDALAAEGQRYELDMGRLITMPPTKPKHGEIEALLVYYLSQVVIPNLLGIVGSGSGFRLSTDPDTVRAPDVWFIEQAQLPIPMDEYPTGGPTLAVEIVSPANTIDEMNTKLTQYFTAGTRMVWLIYPDRRRVDVFTAPTQGVILGETDTLRAEAILPAFALPLRALFKPVIP